MGICLILSQLNKKYNNEITEQDIETGEEICLKCKNIDDDGLKLLCSINFKSIKVLNLSDNNITNIESLSTAPFRQLKNYIYLAIIFPILKLWKGSLLKL